MKTRILLIDDDPDELDIFSDALNGVPGSWDCKQARTAQQGFVLMEHIQPEYIFVDFNLPIVNGIEMLAKIKEDEMQDGIPVFIYSTRINSAMRELALSLGAAGCIEKPGSIQELRSLLKSALVFPGLVNHSFSAGKR